MSEEIVQQQAKRNSELLTQEQVAELAELSVDLPDESPDEAELIEEEAKRAATLEEGLWLRARCLQDGKAAEELWNRSHRATSWLTSLILERPDLFAQPLRSSTAVPMMISLIPTSPWYYDKLAAHLNKHHLGADSGVAAGKNARWGGKSKAATLAYLAFTVIDITKGKHSTDRAAQSLARILAIKSPVLVERATAVENFGKDSVKEWCDLCVEILAATLKPGLIPRKQGRPEKNAESAKPHDENKTLRDQIRARIRDMVSAANKRHY